MMQAWADYLDGLRSGANVTLIPPPRCCGMSGRLDGRLNCALGSAVRSCRVNMTSLLYGVDRYIPCVPSLLTIAYSH